MDDQKNLNEFLTLERFCKRAEDLVPWRLSLKHRASVRLRKRKDVNTEAKEIISRNQVVLESRSSSGFQAAPEGLVAKALRKKARCPAQSQSQSGLCNEQMMLRTVLAVVVVAVVVVVAAANQARYRYLGGEPEASEDQVRWHTAPPSSRVGGDGVAPGKVEEDGVVTVKVREVRERPARTERRAPGGVPHVVNERSWGE